MYYVVGLGNPGEEYRFSRHNVGWRVLEAFCVNTKFPAPIFDKKVGGWVTTGAVGNELVTVLYPETFMNYSGRAVAKLVPKTALKQLIVVYDDVALPFGVVRITFGRGSGGHNGLASVVKSVGSNDFVRIRIGIGKVRFWPWESKEKGRRPASEALSKYVLGQFSKREQGALSVICKQAATAIIDSITLGYSQAMNIHNQVN